MFFSRLLPLIKDNELADIRSDFQDSRKLEKYRMGRLALYFPAGFSWKYLPFKKITGIRQVTRLIESDNGVCPFAMEVPSVRIFYDGRDEVLEIEKKKSTDALLQAAAAAGIPVLDPAPGRTRK